VTRQLETEEDEAITTKLSLWIVEMWRARAGDCGHQQGASDTSRGGSREKDAGEIGKNEDSEAKEEDKGE
jgi:hypothetical protein